MACNIKRSVSALPLSSCSEQRLPTPSVNMKSFLVYAAAALGGLAVASPVQSQRNDTESSLLEKRATSFWYANMNRDAASRGFAPDLDNDVSIAGPPGRRGTGTDTSQYSYPVYVAVDAGDGGALQDAINVADNGNQRPGEWLASEPRVVYLPPGTYEISSTLYMKTDTVLMGDATNPPVSLSVPHPSRGSHRSPRRRRPSRRRRASTATHF